MKLQPLFVDRERRFALEADAVSARTFLSIPVRNATVEYCEYYEVDRETFVRYLLDPSLAHDLVGKARRREVDHLLLFKPGSDRGIAD